VEAINRVAVGDRLFFLCSLQRDVVCTDKFILLANLLGTLPSLLNSNQSSQAYSIWTLSSSPLWFYL